MTNKEIRKLANLLVCTSTELSFVQLPSYEDKMNRFKKIILDALTRAQSEDKAIADAGRKLHARLKEIHEDDNYKSVWFCYHNHGGRYDGPYYTDEMKVLGEAIDAARTEEKTT